MKGMSRENHNPLNVQMALYLRPVDVCLLKKKKDYSATQMVMNNNKKKKKREIPVEVYESSWRV
jgi:hypothetical protein